MSSRAAKVVRSSGVNRTPAFLLGVECDTTTLLRHLGVLDVWSRCACSARRAELAHACLGGGGGAPLRAPWWPLREAAVACWSGALERRWRTPAVGVRSSSSARGRVGTPSALRTAWVAYGPGCGCSILHAVRIWGRWAHRAFHAVRPRYVCRSSGTPFFSWKTSVRSSSTNGLFLNWRNEMSCVASMCVAWCFSFSARYAVIFAPKFCLFCKKARISDGVNVSCSSPLLYTCTPRDPMTASF